VSLRSALLVAVLFAVAAPAAAQAKTIRINPGQSFASAYNQAAAGDVIEVGPGVYGAQDVPSGSKAVTFRGLSGNKVRKLDNHASNVTFEGLDLDANGGTPAGAVFENHGAPHVTLRNSRVGNVVDEKGALLGGWTSTASLDTVIDNVTFHDVRQVGDGVHNECVFSQAPGLVVRNSTFRNCATMDLMITRGDWWGQPTYGGVTLINNVFAHSVQGADPRWHYFGFLIHGDMGQLTNVRVVNNVFENDVGGIKNEYIGAASGVWANNIGGGWDCIAGVTYRNNLGKKCHGSDIATSPAVGCAPPVCTPRQIAPVGWVDSIAHDFRLKAGSPAIGAANPSYAPATDRLGYKRDSQPDVGPYEYGAGPAGGGSPPPGAAGAWRLQKARLTKRTICRTPRRRCPASTKLKLALGRPAAVAIKVAKLRKNGKGKRVRTKLLRQVRLHRATRIRARGLRVGRYRLTVRATDAAGLRSKPRRLRLRVLR
jgi:hypothetical protein